MIAAWCRRWVASLAAPVCVVAVLALCLANAAHAASPELRGISPSGAQRGTEATFTFTGNRLADVEALLLYQPGITTLELTADRENSVTARVAIAEDAPLGEHPVRLRTASGITELATFYIGALPVVDEVEPNNDFFEPQAIPMNVTVHGRITNEDVDYFAVEGVKGERLSVEIEAMRLGGAMFDPYVAILDSNRFELAVSDDTALLVQDSHASIILPEDGRYIIQVREASYGGGNDFHYRLHVGTFPRPTAVYPAGGQAGETLDVTFVGDPAGPIVARHELPAEPVEQLPLFAEQDGQIAPSANVIRVSAFANVLEIEPNNNRNQATPYDGELPVAFNGVIAEDGDQDHFRFAAKRGQRLEIEVYARRLRSPLDSVLNILGSDGRSLAGNDDSRGPDSHLSFDVPADGEYVLRIRDHLGRGGEDFVYRVEVTPREPRLTVELPVFNNNRPQDQQTVTVPKGNRFATLLRINREQFGGPVTLDWPNLPEGVSVRHQAIDGSMGVVPVLFEATEDAAVAGSLTPIVATHATDRLTVTGGFTQAIPLVIAAPNRTQYYATQVDRLAVAVGEPAPFSVRLVPPTAPLVRNGVMELPIEIERAEGYNEPITLRMLWNPPGVGSSGSVSVPADQTTATYPMNANDRANLNTWQITVLATGNTPRGAVTVATDLTDLRIAEPYVTGGVQMAAGTQGQPAALLVTLSHPISFEGEAKLELLGLPHGVTAEPLTISSGQEEAVFTLNIADDAHVGTHRNVHGRVTVMHGEESAVGLFGHGGVLRVDAPRVVQQPQPQPEAQAQAETPAQPAEQVAEQPAAPPRPLSRLEQLRLEREQRLGGNE